MSDAEFVSEKGLANFLVLSANVSARKLSSLPTLTSLKVPPPKLLLILEIMRISCPSFVITVQKKNRKN